MLYVQFLKSFGSEAKNLNWNFISMKIQKEKFRIFLLP